MNVYVCIDDTDSLDSRGTGELADILAREVEKRKWGLCSSVTRHQLYVHPDIPYTSHNSSMCFTTCLEEGKLESLRDYAARFLAEESAEGSDPGLCIATDESLSTPEQLIEFGIRAKKSVITMQEAYDLARQMGIHLSSHGGTGQGIIGALAGVGLRLGGNDGKMRGSLDLPAENGVITVDDILSHPAVDVVRTLEGVSLEGSERVRLVDKVKTVLVGGKMVLLVLPDGDVSAGGGWKTCTRQQLKGY